MHPVPPAWMIAFISIVISRPFRLSESEMNLAIPANGLIFILSIKRGALHEFYFSHAKGGGITPPKIIYTPQTT